MTDEVLEQLMSRLGRKLGVTEPDEETAALMQDELLDAEGEIKLYLNAPEVEEPVFGKLVELAAIYYRRDKAEAAGVKSQSYSEGQISQSEAYLTPAEYRQAVEELVKALSRYRRVSCRERISKDVLR